MALSDIVGATGDSQDFIVELPAGNGSYVPADILMGSDEAILCVEVPEQTGGGGNIFIMSE